MSEILHARVYGLDLSKGIARAEIFFAGLKENRVQTYGGRTLVAYSTSFKKKPLKEEYPVKKKPKLNPTLTLT